MATYVLVHGAWGGGWSWNRTIAAPLRADGHDVLVPTLTGLGERSHLASPGIGLDTHIRDVVNVLFYEDLRDVILVGHSYGGMVITGAADRERDRILGPLGGVFTSACGSEPGLRRDAADPANGPTRRGGSPG